MKKDEAKYGLDESADERRKRLESLVIEGLVLVRQAVALSVPDESQFELALPGSRFTRFHAEEIARRIQILSHGWIISTDCSGGNPVITLVRLESSALPVGTAAGFDVSEVQRHMLVEASPAIEAAISAVTDHFRQFGRDPEAWEVQFPAASPDFFVLRQAARRIQEFSADWTIEAHETTRTITGRRN